MFILICILFIISCICLSYLKRQTSNLRKEARECPKDDEERNRILREKIKTSVYWGELCFAFVVTFIALICAHFL